MPSTVQPSEILTPPAGGIFAPDESHDVLIAPDKNPPAPPPPPYVSPFTNITHTWYGTDGSVWNITDPMDGVFLLQEGIEGLHLPPTDYVLRESPSAAGSSFHGYRIKSRPVTWFLYVFSDDSSDHFFDLDTRLWQSMQIGENGVWRVTLPNGKFRELTMRIVPNSETFDRDPGLFGWKRYALQFSADENPFWTVPHEVPGSRVTFSPQEGSDFFNDGKAPNFIIDAAMVESARIVRNDGDEDVYPVITINGPMDSVDFTIGERSFTSNAKLLSGESLVIDTNPRTFSITDNEGNDRIRDLTTWIFDPIPPKKDTPLLVVPKGQGNGSVIIDMPPLYHRAW